MPRRKNRSTAIARPVRPVVVRVGAPARTLVRRSAALAHHVGRRAIEAAEKEKHTLTAIAAAGIMGWARSSDAGRDLIERLPALGPLGVEGTLALGFWVFGRWGRSRIAEHVATGLGSVAIYRLARGEDD